LKRQGVTDVVIAPIGFVSDHMEVVYDLDTQAKQLCKELGLNMIRAKTAGTHPAFVSMIRELILERMDRAGRDDFGRASAAPVPAADCSLFS
jgi:ferrochelatase